MNRVGRRPRASGAALLEFLAVCIPLMTIVFNALEFARYSQVKMNARYASAQGARACSVYADHKYNPSGAAANAAAVENIVRAELSPWAGKWFQVNDIGRCNLAGGSSEDEHSPVSYQVSLGYKCSYPLSFCKVSAPVVPASVTMAMQGARYARRGDSVDPMTWCAKRDSSGTVCLDGTDTDAGVNSGDAGGVTDRPLTGCELPENKACCDGNQMVEDCHRACAPNGYTDCERAGDQAQCARDQACHDACGRIETCW